MSSELFPTEAVTMDSPRLAWMKRHRVLTYHSTIKPAVWYAGLDEANHEFDNPCDFFAKEEAENGDRRIGFGDTEDEAIAVMCEKMHIKLWNEETSDKGAN